MRAADSDRERVLEVVRQAHADGRLSTAEFYDRLDNVYLARGQSEPTVKVAWTSAAKAERAAKEDMQRDIAGLGAMLRVLATGQMDVSGRYVGTGAYRAGGAYDAAFVLRQDGEEVFADGTIRFTDAAGGVVEVPYSLRATYDSPTLTFPSGFGVATLSEDGRSLRWLYGDGTGAFELVRR